MNDPRLSGYLAAEEEEIRSRELERVLTGDVQPHVRAVLARYVRGGWPLGPHDADDIVGQVTLRVLVKLRAATVLEEESLQNVEAYVTTLTKNAVRDFMRRRSPVRTRVKARLRYLLMHDARLALWNRDGVALCGLASWPDTAELESVSDRVTAAVRTAGGLASARPETVIAIMNTIGKPVRLGHLVTAMAGGSDAEEPVASDEGTPASQAAALEARQYLEILWSEIRELPANQRAALLLNLREPGSGNAVMLFLSVGIATLEEIASSMSLSPDGLRAIWDDLPLDDLRIAEHLGLRRQQVINLRKAARERLGRRMASRERPRQ